MEETKKWVINKRIYNRKRNSNLVCLGALLDMDTFNKIQKIKKIKGINNVEYVRECYKIIMKKESE